LQGCLREENITLSGNGNLELRTLREHLNSPAGVLVGSMLLIFLVVCVILLFVFTFQRNGQLRVHKKKTNNLNKNTTQYMLDTTMRKQTYFNLHNDDIWMICFIYIICVCWHIVVSNTYCDVFVLFVSSYCVPYVTGFSGLSIFDCPFGTL
jgi:hypothetical protein